MTSSKKHFALTGMPLGHSLSPFIHGALMREKGLDGDYRLCETESLNECFESTLSALDGFNVTIPYKQAILPLLDEMQPRASLYGAVNTVAVKDGKATGYNTDCIGFLRSLEAAGLSLGGRVLVLGCGGAARVFAFESALAGAEVTLGIRAQSAEKAQRLSCEMEEKCGAAARLCLLDEVHGAWDYVLNATPVGMSPHTDASPLKTEALADCAAVFDAIYNPAETQLLHEAKAYGAKTLNGLPMLVWQAAAAQEIWNGVRFTASEIDTVLRLTEKELLQR